MTESSRKFSIAGSGVRFWSQLVFFTYFLIKQNLLDQYDTFLQQFKEQAAPDHGRKLTRDNLQHFLTVCSSFLPQITDHLERNPVNTLGVFFSMFGLLPIDQENVLATNGASNDIFPEIYDYLQKYLIPLVDRYGKKWSTISKGLISLLSIPLVSEYKITFDTVGLLHQLNDRPDRQSDIAKAVLLRLIDFRMPITCRNWIEIFRMTNDQSLIVGLLDIQPTFDQYVNALDQLTECCPVLQNQAGVVNNLNLLVDRSKMISAYPQAAELSHHFFSVF